MPKSIFNDKSLYTNEEGPYKTVTLLSISPKRLEHFTSRIFKHIDTSSTVKFKHFHKNTNFFFINANLLPLNMLLLAIRSSDIVVFFYDTEILTNTEQHEINCLSIFTNSSIISAIKKHLPSFIFCIKDIKIKNAVKDFISTNFGDGKIVTIDNLLNHLTIFRHQNTKLVEMRPCFIPESCEQVDDLYVLRGFMRRGFLTRRVVCNGGDEFEILSVCGDDFEIAGEELDRNEIEIVEDEKSRFEIAERNEKKDKNINLANLDSNLINMNLINENNINWQNNFKYEISGNGENNFKFENGEYDENKENDASDESAEIDESSICEESVEESKNNISNNNDIDLIETYKNYRGIKCLSTCKFTTDKYPKYYNDISVFKKYKDLERAVNKVKSNIGDNQMIEIAIKRKSYLEDTKPDLMIFYNLFEYESTPTLCNLTFNSEEDIVENELLVLDLGHKIIQVRPLLTSISQSNVHKCKSSLRTGVMTFIGPLTLNVGKVLIYKEKVNPIYQQKEGFPCYGTADMLNDCTYVGVGQGMSFEERVIVEEVRLKGYPDRVDKRYCTVKGMFNNKKEVMYFRNMGLSTQNGNKGIIKKPIGTHGIFKAYFNKPVQHGNVISISLYKRVFPLN